MVFAHAVCMVAPRSITWIGPTSRISLQSRVAFREHRLRKRPDRSKMEQRQQRSTFTRIMHIGNVVLIFN